MMMAEGEVRVDQAHRGYTVTRIQLDSPHALSS